ncbi:MAG TPA: hypothetical protein VGK45_16400 [Thermoanaerobaculia bacterium]|jgi:hypothetical protein
MRPSAATIAATMVFALFVAGLTASLSWSVARSARRIEMSFVHAGESPLAERSREMGAPYAREIEEIRHIIPRDGAYALVDGDGAELGGAVWVRFDLEPRRAVLLGLRKDLPKGVDLRRRIPPEAQWVVVAYAEGPPRLMTVAQLLAERP